MRVRLALVALLWTMGGARAAMSLEEARSLAESGRLLSLRVHLKRAAKGGPMDAATWLGYWRLILAHPEVGYDLLYAWKSVAPPGASNNKINLLFDQAQDKALAGDFVGAARTYLRLARALRPRLGTAEAGNVRSDLRVFYPFVLQGLGRALYAMGRYQDALRVFEGIPATFPRYRQVVFEKMWAAFRAGDVDVTLGATASQRSAFFETILEPEAFLIEVYLFRRLCREDDAKSSLAYVLDSERRIRDGSWGMKDWVRRDLETSALYHLSETQTSDAAEAEEAGRIRAALEKRFNAEKARLLRDFTQVKAYSRLALLPSAKHLLKPIQKLPSRETLLSQDLEIWPADSGEAWVDELGRYRFLGESKCADSR
jgi:tetratricopeptide (TPR) repeat protein